MLLTDMRNTLSHQHIIFVPKDEFITCHWGSPSDVIGGSPSELPGKSCVKSSDVLLGASCLSFLGEVINHLVAASHQILLTTFRRESLSKPFYIRFF